MVGSFEVVRAFTEHIDDIVPLFEASRVFYEKASDPDLAEHVAPIVEASIEVVNAVYLRQTSSVAQVTLRNNSSINYTLENVGAYDFNTHSNILRLSVRSDTKVQVKTLQGFANFDLKLKALNVLTAPDQHPEFTLPVSID